MVTGLFCPSEFQPAPSTMASFADNSQFPWMEVALAEIGVRDLLGAGNTNARVLEYFRVAGHAWVRNDETAWCSAFVNWVMAQIGIEGTRRLNARSWLNWGTEVPTASPHYGAVTVCWRGARNSWQGHVAFFAGMERGRMILLGGNQGGHGDRASGGAVTLAPYDADRLLGFRWPPGFPPPNMSVSV